MADEEEILNLFDLLPWEDVMFRYVFPCIPLPDLFQLRACSKQALSCISQYFTCCKFINLSKFNNRFTAETFKIVAHSNSGLHSLNLRHSKNWLSDAVLMPVFEISRKLTKLDLTGCNCVGNGSIQKMAVNCHELRELYLRDCHWLSKEGALVISFNCKKLEKLDLTGCWELTDESVMSLVLYCQRLQFLSVAKIYGISDPAVCKIARSAKCLKHLNLAGCWRVTDNAIRILGEYCKSLTALQVRDCRDITAVSLSRLRARGVKIDVQAHPWQVNAKTLKYLNSLRLQPT